MGVPSSASAGDRSSKSGPAGDSASVSSTGIVGAPIVDAFLAAAITFLCMRRSGGKREPEPVMDRRARRHSRSAGVNNGHARDEKLPILVDIHAWERYLPQGLDDRTVPTAVKTLFDQKQLHVENIYTTADVEITGGLAAALWAVSTQNLPGPITSVMASSRSHLPVMKHCLAYMVTQSMTGDGDPSLLPLLYRAITGERSGGATEPNAHV
ncbi:hypothetical protein B0A55_02028 [Friedmanniomyces simplex]|uniref:Uncharacterized protein n=1 Tax=Friedmanniomyces simplex TaxID=329884 RepID=A0A4U0Y0B8_9PEZI|nr:hypothetical protein B0A55_02028 [Friedmanniomyces simplex]